MGGGGGETHQFLAVSLLATARDSESFPSFLPIGLYFTRSQSGGFDCSFSAELTQQDVDCVQGNSCCQQGPEPRVSPILEWKLKQQLIMLILVTKSILC